MSMECNGALIHVQLVLLPYGPRMRLTVLENAMLILSLSASQQAGSVLRSVLLMKELRFLIRQKAV